MPTGLVVEATHASTPKARDEEMRELACASTTRTTLGRKAATGLRFDPALNLLAGYLIRRFGTVGRAAVPSQSDEVARSLLTPRVLRPVGFASGHDLAFYKQPGRAERSARSFQLEQHGWVGACGSFGPGDVALIRALLCSSVRAMTARAMNLAIRQIVRHPDEVLPIRWRHLAVMSHGREQIGQQRHLALS